MRIIAGEWRGRRITAPPGRDVRPTLDRVREAWMSILQDEIPGAHVLDLFAGSGALGIEALSRGALLVDFVERNPRTVNVLRQNLATLGAESRAHIHRTDAISYIHSLRSPVQIAFADPPYEGGMAQAVVQQWLQSPFANVLGVEHARSVKLPEEGDTRRYGDTAITFYRA
jgi:16S rRNA (guanine966-N2)-methyltransferase